MGEAALLNYGVLGVFAAGMGGFLIQSARFLATKLFDEKTGYVPVLVKMHADFLKTLDERDQQQLEMLRELCAYHPDENIVAMRKQLGRMEAMIETMSQNGTESQTG